MEVIATILSEYNAWHFCSISQSEILLQHRHVRKLIFCQSLFSVCCARGEICQWNLFVTPHLMYLDLFIWGFTSLSTLYRSYHDG